jgi:hypothetical protein
MQPDSLLIDSGGTVFHMYQPETHFRAAMVLFAGVSGLLALWILAAQLSVTSVYKLPGTPNAAAVARIHRRGAAMAANLGVIRGDLWAQSAFTYGDLLWDNSGIGSTNSSSDNALSADVARHRIEKALGYAPHRSDVWLLLAALSSRLNWPKPDPTSALKMSFYTGPSETSLIPLRLLVAARSTALNDPDVQQFVGRDVRMILLHVPALKPAIQAAYHEANSANRRIIESAVNELDPAFVQQLRTISQL